MPTLITGATGLLGANLVRRLSRNGERPRILVRPKSDRRGLRGQPVEEALGDILDPPSLAAAMRGVDRVYHLAGQVRLDAFAEPALRSIHVEGTRHVLQAAQAAGVKRIVHVSSIAAVGHGPLCNPATEETAFNFEGFNPYHRSKRDGEEAALSFARAGLDVVVANPAFVVGPYDVKPTSGQVLLQIASGLMLAYPSGGNNFVNATDVAEGLVLAMECGRSGERYILGGENLTYRTFMGQCAAEVGVAPPSVPIPRGLFGALGRMGDVLGAWAPGLFENMNTPVFQSMFLPAYVSSAKAMRDLGYRPRPVRVGIRDAYRWFLAEGALPVTCTFTEPGAVVDAHGPTA